MIDGGVVRGRRNPRHFKLAGRLKKLRQERGYSRSALSQAAGFTSRVVGYIEQQDRVPRISTVVRLARVLAVSPGWLAFGLGDPTAPQSQDANELAVRLRALRSRCALSRAALAEAAGVLEGSVQRIEEGRGEANVDTVERLAIALGVSPSWLAFGEGAPPASLARPSAGDSVRSID